MSRDDNAIRIFIKSDAFHWRLSGKCYRMALLTLVLTHGPVDDFVRVLLLGRQSEEPRRLNAGKITFELVINGLNDDFRDPNESN